MIGVIGAVRAIGAVGVIRAIGLILQQVIWRFFTEMQIINVTSVILQQERESN